MMNEQRFLMNEQRITKNNIYDVIVIGGGHAGCEAALAAARLGCNTLILTINIQKIALMPCNPSIGGIGKGHLVREIDALGGQMAKVADKAAIQIKTLNSSRGPAVRALRAQADKKIYEGEMRNVLFNQSNLHIKQGLAEDIIVKNNEARGVVTATGHIYEGKTVVLAAGTFMKGRLVIGEANMRGGRMGEWPAQKISTSLKKIGLEIERFQSATPPRVSSRSLDYSKMKVQDGDKGQLTFSVDSNSEIAEQIPSFLTRTTKKTETVVKKYLKYSPIKSGSLKSHGPPYSPSIDPKIINFPDKESHPVFVEPEGRLTQEMYLQGLTTAMPASLQEEIIRTVPGLEEAKIMRLGYAVEYDLVPPQQLKLSLETKEVKGLYLAGQVIGTTGYEEAAALGLMAGINAARQVKSESPLILDRSQAYIGVLIDDLVTKGVDEPYRMFTSRAEYRLMLRCDNADIRLRPIACRIGLATKSQLKEIKKKEEKVSEIIYKLKKYKVAPADVNGYLSESNEGKIKHSEPAYGLLQRPAVKMSMLEAPFLKNISSDLRESVEIKIKYEGYINKQMDEISRFQRLEHAKIPRDTDYSEIKTLSFEAREKLNKVKPASLGQASRIPGVRPSDISILHIYLRN